MSAPTYDPNATSTELNTGTGGSLMDESQITRADANATVVHRTRVVVGADDGTLQYFTADGFAGVYDEKVTNILEQILVHMKVQTGLLMAIASEFGASTDKQSLMEIGESILEG
jgi:hypothetical protein